MRRFMSKFPKAKWHSSGECLLSHLFDCNTVLLAELLCRCYILLGSYKILGEVEVEMVLHSFTSYFLYRNRCRKY